MDQHPESGSVSRLNKVCELTLMLLVRRVVQSHRDEDEEDEEWPEDLHQQLELKHTCKHAQMV